MLPHEDTMAGPVADRLALTEATRANLEPLYLVYAGGGAAAEVLARAVARPPLARVETAEAVHTLWAVCDPAELATVAADLLPRRAVIADGHHRHATYLQHQAEHWRAGDGPGPWDRALVLLVDATTGGPRVDAIHRVVPGLPLGRAVELARTAFRSRRCPVRSSRPAACWPGAVRGPSC